MQSKFGFSQNTLKLEAKTERAKKHKVKLG